MKKPWILVCVLSILLVSCSSKLTSNDAASVIKSGLKLSDGDKLDIVGISAESDSVSLVKLSLNGKAVSVKLRKYDQGWQLDEIQNEIGLWIPASTLANLSDDTEKIRKAMKEIFTIATVLVDYLTDKGMPPANSGGYTADSSLYKALCPMYVKVLPVKDPWGNSYRVYSGTSIDGQYGIADSAMDDILVVSIGSDGVQENWRYVGSVPEAGLYPDRDSSRDLVNLNGSFIRGPRAGTGR